MLATRSFNPLGILILFVACGTASPVEWLPLAECRRQAIAAGKLVMIVQGPDPVHCSVDQSVIARSYVDSALADRRLHDFYDFRIAAHYRPTGLTGLQFGQPEPATRRGKASTNVLTYFCMAGEDGDLLTLHFFVGYPTAEELQSQCDWASDVYTQVQSLPEDRQRAVVMDAHREQLVLQDFQPTAIPSRSNLGAILKAASATRDSRLLARFGQGWTMAERRKLIHSLRPHAELENGVGHLVLTLHPLVKHAILEQPAFELLTGQKYCPPPTRREELTDWFARQRTRNRPCLLIVAAFGAGSDAPEPGGFDHRSWQPRRESIQELLREFDSLQVSRSEFACLLNDSGLTLPAATEFNEVKFAVYPPGGEAMAFQLDGNSDEASLERMLKKMLKKDAQR